MIQPHGGKLINRELTGKEKEEALKKSKSLKPLTLTALEESDLEMITVGALSPLEGFMVKKDFDSVLERMHLANGLVWSLPVVKSITTEEKKTLREGEEVLLQNEEGLGLAILKIDEIFPHDRKKHAEKAYGTLEETHPGVARVFKMGDFLIGGKIWLFERPRHTKFLDYRRDPAQTRKVFESRGWKKAVAFQTRNPIHRAHEYIQKCALEIVDGLLIHPLVGETKGDDIPAEVRMRCYEVLIDKYYQKNRVLLSVFPAAMRYAGPREAIFHALVRKNYGCTHFIVGRDHAGVSRPDGKGFYGPFDAQKIFDLFKPEEIGVTPLFFENSFYCKKCGAMATEKICPHDASDRVALSGTQVREMLKRGEIPPPEFSRPEVARVLIEAYQVKVN
ncbi:MAG: sulfate adenylyltransferase [Candidatus Omnitrophica bacterium]|nr:sulfate adenylyltransferase [Candidatus Omnitrophota bacterium]